MGHNWTETLRRRREGTAPGFGVPADLEDFTRTELDDEAEARGIDPGAEELKTKGDVVAAIQGR